MNASSSISLRSSHVQRLISQRVFFSTEFPFQRKLFVAGRGERRNLFIAAANKRKEKKPFDSHSFVPKPDEATGPFPEAVLLKKKTVREDGRVLPEFADAEEEELYEFLSLQLESDLNVERTFISKSTVLTELLGRRAIDFELLHVKDILVAIKYRITNKLVDDQVRHYEVVYLIHQDRVDEVDGVVSKVQDFVREKKGRIWRLNDWGVRRLAYKIKKTTYANYVLMNFEIDSKYINDFKSMLDKDERIIRHLVMKRDEAITKDCPPPQEFHSLRAQEGTVEGGDDDGDELDLDGYDDGDRENIVVIDDDYDEDDRGTRSGRTSKAEKIAT